MLFLPDKGNHVCFVCGRHLLGTHQLYNHRLHRHVWPEVQLRSYHQDPSSVGGLTAEDISKTRQSKRDNTKPHKQMVIPLPHLSGLRINGTQVAV